MMKRLLSLTAIAGLLLVGCSQKTQDEVKETVDSTATKIGDAAERTIDTIGAKIDDIGDDSADVANRQQVQVTLSDFKIAMPMSLKAGQTRFNIKNTGKTEHSFEVEAATDEGHGDKLMRNLDPGDSTHLDVDLKAGKYNVYCPVDGHADKGMKHTLTVK